MKTTMLRIMKFDAITKAEAEGQAQEGIFIEIGISQPNGKDFQPLRMMLDSALTGGSPLALTDETAKKLNLTATTGQTTAQLGDGRNENMKTTTVDIQIENTYVRGVPAIIGGVPVDIIGFRLMALMDLYIKAGVVAHAQLNEEALKNNLSGPA